MSRFLWLCDFLLEIGRVGGAQDPPEAPVPGDPLHAPGPCPAGSLQSVGSEAGVLQSVGSEAGVLQPALSLFSLQAAGPPAGLDTVNCTVSTQSLISRVSNTFSPLAFACW